MTAERLRGALQTIGEKLLEQIEQETASDGDNVTVSDESLLALYSVFGDVTERALHLLESERIICVQVEGYSRYCFKVTGKDVAPSYLLFPDVNFCQCPAYRHRVINRKGYVMCKHVLAVRLAKILKKYKTDSVTPEQYADILMGQFISHSSDEQPLPSNESKQ